MLPLPQLCSQPPPPPTPTPIRPPSLLPYITTPAWLATWRPAWSPLTYSVQQAFTGSPGKCALSA